MEKTQVKKIALASMLTAVAVVGSTLSFPVFGSRCAPVQHMVNILCGVLLGPWYGLGVAFAAWRLFRSIRRERAQVREFVASEYP